jgi:glycosyltransferase involved in cell wall biosynthesis
MRVVLIHRYFWPDTPTYAHILKAISLALGKAGHEVTVLTCQPSYSPTASRAPTRERLSDRVEVRRWPVLPDRRFRVLKLVNLVWFCARLLLEGARLGKVDVVMAASTPPIGVARVASWLARWCGARFVYHQQDIYPDVLVASGMLRPGGFAALLRRLDTRTEKRAERVVVLSRDMAETVQARGIEPSRIVVLNNFDPWPHTTDDVPPVPPTPLHVVFAGNLGWFQGLENLLQAITQLRDDHRIAFHFFGDGPLRVRIEGAIQSHGLANVTLHGHCPPEQVATFLRTKAHLGVVSLMPGVIRTAYPSKTLSYLRQGCPVLALVEKDSELAETILAAGAGMQVDPTDANHCAATLEILASRPEELTSARARAGDLYRERFAAECQLGRWVQLFEQLGTA